MEINNTEEIRENIKLSLLHPNFQGQIESEVVKYRPIALTSHLAKVFERVVRKALLDHLANNNFLFQELEMNPNLGYPILHTISKSTRKPWNS